MSTQLSLLDRMALRMDQGSDELNRAFHVRRPVPGQALSAASEIASGERKAREQESAVLAFYRANPGAWGPSQVYRMLRCRWPITSIRARITTLERAGLLRITMSRSMGMFGRMEHLWEIAK